MLSGCRPVIREREALAGGGYQMMIEPRWDRARREAFLSTVRLFQRLSSETLSTVAERFQPKRFRDGEFIFFEGDRASEVSLLASGRVKVVRETEEGREVILRLIQPGEIFGAAGMWGEPEYPASALALEDVLILQLPAPELAALVTRSPEFAQAVIRELGTRLREAEARIRELQTERAERRIARALLRLANKAGVRNETGIEIGIPLSRQDLAELSGTTLSTASRTLSAWDRLGLIVAARERVTIVKFHELVAVAEDLAPAEQPEKW
ncbi:MAG TPA: Crp/Fnr family transcriptional regulator [Nitrolancea sp.]|nr:Crp/Fnr family transcriptional regulator [Nitrolancea sp.]